MKLIFKGKFKGMDQLPLGDLPPNAVKFKEPETMDKLVVKVILFTIPAVLLVALIIICSRLLHGRFNFDYIPIPLIVGLFCYILSMFLHELLHAVCFGKGAIVEFYIALKEGMMFVVSTSPVTKQRFIFLSLLPNIVLGWLPFLVWTVLPYGEIYSNILFVFSVLNILGGGGDYMNTYNAIRQMPKGSMQQLSGFNSYWFMP